MIRKPMIDERPSEEINSLRDQNAELLGQLDAMEFSYNVLKGKYNRMRKVLRYCLDDLYWARSQCAEGDEFDEGIKQALAAIEEAEDAT